MDNEKDTLDFSMDDIMRQLQEATLENDAMEESSETHAAFTDSQLPAPADGGAPREEAPEAPGTDALELTLPEEPEVSEADALELAQLAFSQAAQEPEAVSGVSEDTDPLHSFVPPEQQAETSEEEAAIAPKVLHRLMTS